ncbi:alpha/beta hydrolase family protein [Algivirga pacifica]|uniref:Alpha/beta fold hydrolase n=1 Tax=Algivirga pacifica TaxID=1162670 RepID=A0ABP9D2J7_9BACT
MKKIEFVLTSQHGGKRFLADAIWKKHEAKKPVIILIHGFKGFKDWGCFNLMAEQWAEEGFLVVKPNFSMDGTTMDMPWEVTDMEAFSENTFTTELDDIGTAVDWIFDDDCPVPNVDLNNVHLVGHSRGGGMALLKTAEDPRIKKVVTWASIPAITKLFSDDFIEKWKKNGIAHVINGRTGESLPLKYKIVEDYYTNQDRLDIGKAIATLDVPILIIHGSEDETVPVKAAHYLHVKQPGSKMLIVEGAGHTFGGEHPYTKESLPTHSQEIMRATTQFLR